MPVTVQVTVPAGAWTAVLAMARVAELAGAWVMVLAMLQVSMPVTMQVATLVHSSSAVGSACHTAPVEQHLCSCNREGDVPGLAGGAIPPASQPRFVLPMAGRLGRAERELMHAGHEASDASGARAALSRTGEHAECLIKNGRCAVGKKEIGRQHGEPTGNARSERCCWVGEKAWRMSTVSVLKTIKHSVNTRRRGHCWCMCQNGAHNPEGRSEMPRGR